MISKASAHWSIFEKARIVLDGLSGYAHGTLLDVGCGTKPFYEIFQGRVKEYIGVDLPPKIDRPNQKERIIQIDVYGNCLKLPVKDSSIHTVFSSFVIEHIFEYNKFFAEIHRVLKNGSYFIMISPHISVLHEDPCDYFRFTRYSLELIAQNHKFKTINIIPIGGEFLFWGNFVSTHIHKSYKFLNSKRLIEVLSLMVQRVTLYLDNKFVSDAFVCNYLSVFQKQE